MQSMRWMLRGLTALLALGTTVADAQVSNAMPGTAAMSSAFWGDSHRGWHFYEDPPAEPPEKSEAKPPPVAPPANTKADPRVPEVIEFERLQTRLEEYRTVAIIDPSQGNVRRYMELEAAIVRRASRFADVAQRVAWSTPSLDMTLEGRPTNAQALEIFDRQRADQRGAALANLGRTHVLLFFFRSDCPYCHAFAPTLAAFERQHGLRVVPISVDGGGLPTFPQYRTDNGAARTLQVTQVPAVFMAEPGTGSITPIGFGVLSEAQLIERITSVATPTPDARPISEGAAVALRTP